MSKCLRFFAQRLNFKADFHSKMSVSLCSQELGLNQNPYSPRQFQPPWTFKITKTVVSAHFKKCKNKKLLNTVTQCTDLSICNMAIVRHIGFSNFEIFHNRPLLLSDFVSSCNSDNSLRSYGQKQRFPTRYDTIEELNELPLNGHEQKREPPSSEKFTQKFLGLPCCGMTVTSWY